MMKDKFVKIPLQFFGESGDDFDEDFDYEDEDVEIEEDADEADDDEEEVEGDGDDKTDAQAELIAELKAAGYVGDDIAALTADMKKKREAKEKASAPAERRAAMSEGKGHIKSGKPSRSSTGEGAAAFTAKDLAEINACLKNPTKGEKGRSRVALERVIRKTSK